MNDNKVFVKNSSLVKKYNDYSSQGVLIIINHYRNIQRSQRELIRFLSFWYFFWATLFKLVYSIKMSYLTK